MGSSADRAAPSAAVHIYSAGDEVCVGVRVSPSAPKTRIIGLLGDRLKVAVAAPPEDNRANKELEEALAGWLAVASSQVRVAKGHASRDKVVAFKQVGEERLRGSIGEALRASARHGSR